MSKYRRDEKNQYEVLRDLIIKQELGIQQSNCDCDQDYEEEEEWEDY